MGHLFSLCFSSCGCVCAFRFELHACSLFSFFYLWGLVDDMCMHEVHVFVAPKANCMFSMGRELYIDRCDC